MIVLLPKKDKMSSWTWAKDQIDILHPRRRKRMRLSHSRFLYSFLSFLSMKHPELLLFQLTNLICWSWTTVATMGQEICKKQGFWCYLLLDQFHSWVQTAILQIILLIWSYWFLTFNLLCKFNPLFGAPFTCPIILSLQVGVNLYFHSYDFTYFYLPLLFTSSASCISMFFCHSLTFPLLLYFAYSKHKREKDTVYIKEI